MGGATVADMGATHADTRLIDLSHRITEGMETYPGLPVPVVGTHLSREAAERLYAPGTTFHIGLITMCTNTGTYLDVPFHRYADGHDLAALALERVAAVPAVCLDRRDIATIDLTPDELAGLAGHAVLVRTDHSVHFGTPQYMHEHPHLSAASAEALVAADVACVGIDSLNIDGTSTGERPVHSILLAAGIPIVEHLTGLASLPERSFKFTAVPPKIEGAGTFAVRAYATIAADGEPS
jgi:kynurenine formamidase